MKRIDRITLRKWKGLKWRDPRTDLINLGKLQNKMADATVHDLRNHQLKWALEQRQAALFSYLISYAVLGSQIAYAMLEDEDYDCILSWREEGKSRYCPVQLKEIVPSQLSASASVESGLLSLQKYATSYCTVVAMHVNRAGYFDYSQLSKPKASVAEVWLFSSLRSDQSLWFLYGDLLSHRPCGFEIPWPTRA